jgi:site-specific DNA-methyltransferase (adenine-specific)
MDVCLMNRLEERLSSVAQRGMTDTIVAGNALELIKALPDRHVGLVITSPPYFGQRCYTNKAQEEIGREPSVDAYIHHLIDLFRQCVRVTKDNGNLVFNLGDKYLDGNLLLAPYRFAIAARQHAILVNNITWVKTNPTPRQFTRRMVSSTEPFFHFAKTPDYVYNVEHSGTPKKDAKHKTVKKESKIGQGYFDLIDQSGLAVEQKKQAKSELNATIQEIKDGKYTGLRMKIKGLHTLPFGGQEGGRLTQIQDKGYTIIKMQGRKIQRDVIESPVETIKGQTHSAVYPLAVIKRLICLLTHPNDIVLDPFLGSGTTAVAAKETGRHFIGFELSEDFAANARKRVDNAIASLPT